MKVSNMSKRNQSVNNNVWKRRFMILVATNVFLLFILGIYLYSPIPITEIEESGEEYKIENSSEFVVRTTKQNLNNLVNAYLDKLLTGTDHHYTVHLDEDVRL